MVDEELRAKVIARAKEKVRKCKPLAILESLTLIEYIEELEAAQHSVQADGAKCPDCGGNLWDWYCANCHREFTPHR